MEREDGVKSETSSIEDNEDEEDPFETRIGDSGCSKYHYALQVLKSAFFFRCHN